MQEKRYTLTADFEIQGRLAYLSHQETLTLFQRALIRAGLPLAFSGGFNPRPRLSIPLPRSVGCQSSVERICAGLETQDPIDTSSILPVLQSQLPLDCRITAIQCLEGKAAWHAVGVQYAFCLLNPLDDHQRGHLENCQEALAAGQCIEIQRYRAKKRKWDSFDLSPFVEQLSVCDDCVEVLCRVSQAGTVRIDELMQWMQLTVEMLAQPVRRTAIQWQAKGAPIESNEKI